MAAEQDLLPSIYDGLGNKRPLGFLAGDPRRMESVPRYADTTELIPEKDWEEFDEWPDVVKIKDQNGKGACNGHAAATAVEVARYVAGMPHIPMSAWFVYAILCRGVDRGSLILDALELTQDKGVCPDDMVRYGTIQPRGNISDQAYEAAKRFRVEIGGRITTYEELGTAIVRRESINLAVCVGNGFNNLDADDVPQLGNGACNHAVYVGMSLKRRANGEVLGGMTNSWNERWGRNGRCRLPLKRVVRAAYFEAYTIRAVVDDTADNTRPPDLIA